MKAKPIIGLAGGIGAGKSTAARVFAELGAVVIDSDRLNREQLADPEVRATIREWWGDSVCDESGGIDRKALADVVFNDPAALERLEGLLYPRIRRRREELLARYHSDPAVRAVVLDTPKLLESRLDRLCDAVVFVDARREVRVERLAKKRGWGEEELARREKLQNRLDNKKARADYIVVNNSRVEELRPSIERILASVLASFRKSGGGSSPAT